MIDSHLEGDDQVDLLAHLPDELGPQVAREPDLWLLCGRSHKVGGATRWEEPQGELGGLVA